MKNKNRNINMVERKLRILIPVLLLFLLCLSGCENAEKKRMLEMYGENHEITGDYDDSLAVKCNNGVFVGLKDGNVISYKGIPYAIPPVGERRWKKPELAPDGDKAYEAYYFGKSPIQSEWGSEVGSYYPCGEDCLTLNVWVNEKGPEKESASKPVMVFFHGGAYGWGATSDPIYDGHNLVDKFDDIILVTVEYRVGMMGFIDFTSVPGGEDFKESGNLGILDQICSLEWIQKNIAEFGGDPGNVTIFGESAGAGSVSLIPVIDEADGLYRRIIAESGSMALTYSKQECQNLTQRLLKDSGCQNMDELMALSEEEITQLNETLNDYNNFPERDNVILPEDLYIEYDCGRADGIDMLIGTNKDETRYWIYEMGYYSPVFPEFIGYMMYVHGMPIMYENNLETLDEEEMENVKAFMALQNDKEIWNETEFYNEMLFRVPAMKQAEYHSDNGNPTYTYYWTYPGENKTVGACHAIELSSVFDNLDERLYTGDNVNEELADEVQNMWVNFARTGDPSTDSHTWEQYDTKTRKTMVLGEDIHMEEDIKAEQRELMEPLLDHYFNGCYSQLNLNVPQVYRIINQIIALSILIISMIGCVIILTIRNKNKRKMKKKKVNES